MFKELFGSCSTDGGPVEPLVVDAFWYTEMYALEYGFARNSSRLPVGNYPRAPLFAENPPRASVDAASLLYCAAPASSVRNHLAAEPYRLLQGEVARRVFSGALFSGDGYVCQCGTRAQAPRQLLGQVWLMPTLCRRNCAVLTGMAASALDVCLEKLVAGSRPSTVYGQPPGEPWRRKTVLGNVVGHLMFSVVVNSDSGPAPHLRVCLAGCVQGVRESHLLLPSDAHPRSRRDGRFVARQREPTEDLPRARQRLCHPWCRIEREWGAGDIASTFEFVASTPVRFVCGGAGGKRILGVALRPASWEFWLEINRDAATASGMPYAWIDATLNAHQRMAQRAGPPSAGGGMSVYLSNSGSNVALPLLMSYSEVKGMFDLKLRRLESGICRYQDLFARSFF